MSSIHKAPYCGGKIALSQDDFRNRTFGSTIKCPHCRQEIGNEDVVECVKFGKLISLIKVSPKSKLASMIFEQ